MDPNIFDSDWENKRVYIIKKLFESSIDEIVTNLKDFGLHRKIPSLEESDYLATLLDEDKSKEEKARIVDKLYSLVLDKDFFTKRQKQVILLMLGWNGYNFVGPKKISQIAKILKIAQPVVYNHYKLFVKKLKKYFSKNPIF